MPDLSPVDLHGVVTGSGPGLVLLHPVGLDHSFWSGLPARCAAKHRVLALDLRGHGSSPKAEKGTPIEAYAGDVSRAMTRQAMGPSIVLGLSFGGMIAQMVALLHPDQVAAVIPCGCPPGIPPEARDVLRERGLAAERDGMQAVVDATIARWFTPAFVSDPVVETVRARLLSDDPTGWSAGWHAIAGFDARPRLGEINVPARVIGGTSDAATPQAASEAMAAGIPGGELVMLAGASHMMQIENETAFGDAVIAFLDRFAKESGAAH